MEDMALKAASTLEGPGTVWPSFVSEDPTSSPEDVDGKNKMDYVLPGKSGPGE